MTGARVAVLVALACAAVGHGATTGKPVLVTLETGGTVHDIPVATTATLYADQTWEMECRSLGTQRPALAFAIVGEFVAELDARPPRLHFSTTYADARVDLVLDCAPGGRGVYADRETAGTRLERIRLDAGIADRVRAAAAAGRAVPRLDKVLARCVR